jgi:hypothetical protein
LEKRSDQDIVISQIPLNPPCLPAGRLFQRGKYFTSLWKREVGRDFMKYFSKN